jgi:mRNA interferase MazF
MIPKPREVYLLPFPFADMSRTKQRPGMVISTEKFTEETGLCIVCSISTNESLPCAHRITDADLEYGRLYGHSSAVLYGALSTVENGLLGKRILKLKTQPFSEIMAKLGKILALRG